MKEGLGCRVQGLGKTIPKTQYRKQECNLDSKSESSFGEFRLRMFKTNLRDLAG